MNMKDLFKIYLLYLLFIQISISVNAQTSFVSVKKDVFYYLGRFDNSNPN